MFDERQRKLANRLPAVARDKLTDLDMQATRHAAAVRSLSDEKHSLLAERNKIEATFEKWRKQGDISVFNQGIPDTSQSFVADLEEKRAANQAAFDRLTEEVSLAAALASPLRSIIDRAMDMITSTPQDQHFKMLPRAWSPRSKDKSAPAAIERCRERINQLQAELAEVEAAPLPSSVAKKRAAEQISALASGRRPDVMQLILDARGSISWPTRHDHVLSEHGGSVSSQDAVGLLAWLFKDQMIAAVNREIDAAAMDDEALSPADKAKKLAELRAEILACERDECAFIDQAAKDGMSIAYRADISILALLGLDEKLDHVAAADPIYESKNIAPRQPYIPADQPAQRDAIWQ